MVSDRLPRDPADAPSAIVCIGASAGGVEPIRAFVSGFLEESMSLFVVLHMAQSGSALHSILQRSTSMPVVRPRDGDPIEPGSIYVAVPNHHLAVEPGRVRLPHGPKENGVRPAVDLLFRTAAEAYGDRAVGVVLSGTGDDGAAGANAIKRAGGIVVVQDPAEALFDDMPQWAIDATDADAVAPVAELPSIIVDRLSAHAQAGRPPAEMITATESEASGSERRGGGNEDVASKFTCPDCGGTLFDDLDAGVERFVCRVGHGFNGESLLQRQVDNLENVMWSAARALEEQADLSLRLMERMRRAGRVRTAEDFRLRHEQARRHAEAMREMALKVTASMAQETEATGT